MFRFYSRQIYFSQEQAYDEHLNIILGDVEEKITVYEVDTETLKEVVKVRYF